MKLSSLFRRSINVSFVFLFVTMLMLPLIQMKFCLFPDYPPSDNRTLATNPKPSGFGLKASKHYLHEFEAYFKDNFGFRNSLIRLNSMINFFVYRKSPVAYVVIGKAGFLFYNALNDGISLSDFEGKVQFSETELSVIKSRMSKLEAEFDKRMIKFIVVMAPNKHTIYPDFLPDNIRTKRGFRSRADQLDKLFSELGIDFIDLRPVLLSARKQSNLFLYYLTDTHWNSLGAFWGYQEIGKRILKTVPTFRKLSFEAFEINIVNNSGSGDMANMVGMTGALKDIVPQLIPKKSMLAKQVQSTYGKMSLVCEVGNNTLPRLLVFRDSFSTALIPYLAEGFSKSIYLWQHNIDFSIIDKEKPDVVILEFVERYSSILTETQ